MQLLNPPLIFSPFSLFSRKFSFKTCDSKAQPKIFHNTPSVPFYLPFSTTRNFHVSAHFGRRTSSRRNSLRKKLVDDQQVRQKTPPFQNSSSELQNPEFSFDDVDNSRENLDFANVKEGDFGNDNDLFQSGRFPESKKLGEPVLLSKLENWVDQYRKDAAYWGTGSDPIFTVFHDLEGNVKKVLIDEDEILKRSQVKKGEFGDLTEVNSKILSAKGLAREMESGANVIPRNSTVAKFVVYGEESGFLSKFQGVVRHPEFVPVVSRGGMMVFCGFVAIWAAKKLFIFGNKEEQFTELEKEMMRRKIKSRKEKEKGRVEVVQEPLESPMLLAERPKLDKQELMKNIYKAKAASKDELLFVDSSGSQTTNAMNFDSEIQTIRAMARQAREIESGKQAMVGERVEEQQTIDEEPLSEMRKVKELKEVIAHCPSDIQNKDSGHGGDMDVTDMKKTLNESMSDGTGYILKLSAEENKFVQEPSTSNVDISGDRQTMANGDFIRFSDFPDHDSLKSKNRSKRRVIRSVKEAREFLAKKGVEHIQERQFFNGVQESDTALRLPDDEESSVKTNQRGLVEEKVSEPITSRRILKSSPVANASQDFTLKEKEFVATKNDASKDSEDGQEGHDKPWTSLDHDINGSSTDRKQSVNTENWMEKNFHVVDPIVKKIGEGFRENYRVAREKVNQHENTSIDVAQLQYNQDDSELEWMKDDGLREIVFQVRENELTGRDPFYMMDAEDKLKFFKGLEKKVEQENEKLVSVHEYLHSNIENLDYGADGISLYDPPEKFIPRWKGPPPEKNPELLGRFLEEQKSIFSGNSVVSYPVKKNEQKPLQEHTDSLINENFGTSLADYDSKKLHDKNPKNSKIVIEGSDGSVRAGKKSGKEYWQHTKKWSHGFLESYNAEADPEVKSIMKDIGKDLDRWITEEEVQEAADLIKKIPERNKKFMEKKINKLKREMKLFGPQAVVSKYREYADEKEEDYLWWLDLPHILCIELYTNENGEQKIGFYSLEMAADLELELKPIHVIAFEDAGDCKNLCCIIQAHMEMLGNGHAFVVPRPPKDAFREAKANGFGVTVIRKQEFQLNVDQTLEEVEELISEIGSKIYHDKLMQERSVDINSLMRGVFGASDQTTGTKRKRSKRMLKKPSKKKPSKR